MKLKVGTYLPNVAYGDHGIDHTARLRNWIVRSEELGFESIWVTDLFGTLDEIVEACRVRAQIGIEHLVLHPYTDDPAQLELWGRELLSRLRALDVTPARA